MKPFLLALALTWQVVQIQEPPVYPAGSYCTPKGDRVQGTQTADHPCHCKQMADPETSCETPKTHDPVCKQYCHEEHCSCPMECPK